MTLAIRYILLGFLAAIPLQIFADPPTWALLVSFISGLFAGIAFTLVQMYFVDILERRGL